MAARRPVVAIDGPAGVGKSTLGRNLASELGVAYLNTGAMYRALTARALRDGVDPDDGEALAELAVALRFALDRSSVPPSLMIEGAAPGGDLATPDVEANVSRVARHAAVRRVMAEEQRRLGRGGGVVEGRDIGTVVLPDADVKIFLRAAPDVRAARRMAERGERSDAMARALERRDELDARTNPLVPAPDAVPIDTEGRAPDEVLAEALAVVRARVESA